MKKYRLLDEELDLLRSIMRPNPRPNTGAPIKRYLEQDVAELALCAESDRQHRMGDRRAKLRDEAEHRAIAATYQDLETSLLPAAYALVKLYRHINTPKCTEEQKQLIRDIAKAFREILFQLGFCWGWSMRTTAADDKPCFTCRLSEYRDRPKPRKCRFCQQSGFLVEHYGNQYALHAFMIGGQRFHWRPYFDRVFDVDPSPSSAKFDAISGTPALSSYTTITGKDGHMSAEEFLFAQQLIEKVIDAHDKLKQPSDWDPNRTWWPFPLKELSGLDGVC